MQVLESSTEWGVSWNSAGNSNMYFKGATAFESKRKEECVEVALWSSGRRTNEEQPPASEKATGKLPPFPPLAYFFFP